MKWNGWLFYYLKISLPDYFYLSINSDMRSSLELSHPLPSPFPFVKTRHRNPARKFVIHKMLLIYIVFMNQHCLKGHKNLYWRDTMKIVFAKFTLSGGSPVTHTIGLYACMCCERKRDLFAELFGISLRNPNCALYLPVWPVNCNNNASTEKEASIVWAYIQFETKNRTVNKQG